MFDRLGSISKSIARCCAVLVRGRAILLGNWVVLLCSCAVFFCSCAVFFCSCAVGQVGDTPATEAGAAETPRTSGLDWPRFLGPRGDGVSLERGIEPSLWKPHPPLKWSLPLGVSYGGPAVSQGRLLQWDRYGDEERLTCYEATTGRELWQRSFAVQYEDMYGYNNGPRCSPLVDGQRVYVYGVAGNLSCVDLSSGAVKWTKDVAAEYGVVQNFFGVASNPVIHDDKLLVMVGGSPPENRQLPAGRLDLVRSNGTAVVAFDKQTGDELYRVGNDLASYASLTVRELNGQPTGLAFLRGGLLAWDPDSGREMFQFPWRSSKLESVNAAVPVTTDSQVLLSEAYEVGSVLLAIEGGKPQVVRQDQGRLSQLSFRAHWSTPVLIEGYLYGCSGRNQPDSSFRCVRWEDGEVMWSDRRHERSSLIYVDGYLIVLGEYGRLELIRPSPKQLNVVAEADLSQPNPANGNQPLVKYPCWAAPVLAQGLLYVRGKDHLMCLDLIPPSATSSTSR